MIVTKSIAKRTAKFKHPKTGKFVWTNLRNYSKLKPALGRGTFRKTLRDAMRNGTAKIANKEDLDIMIEDMKTVAETR